MLMPVGHGRLRSPVSLALVDLPYRLSEIKFLISKGYGSCKMGPNENDSYLPT